MADLIGYTLSNGGSVVVLAGDTDRAGLAGLGDRMVGMSAATLRAALAPVVAAASDIAEAFQGVEPRPDGFEVRFGVTLDGKLGGVIANATAGVQFQVTLRWSAAPSEP